VKTSAIIPAYQAAKYLAEAIESALAQTRPPDEIIVVDDGSTDGTADIAAGFGARVRCERQAHAGIGAARNRGLALARGERIAFLDADDLWTPAKLEVSQQALDADPGVAMVFGHVRQFRSPEVEDRDGRRPALPGEPVPGYVPGGGLFRREAFERVGPFETCWRVGEFVGWYERAMAAGLRPVLIPEVVLLRRIHATNVGLLQRDARTDYVRILKAALDRRRAREKAP
jgi:glycosyltransferase involved in cell wall biosynthesis